MPFPAETVAKTIAKQLNWSVTNLQLQKMVYIAHMFYLGRTGEELVKERFQAWDYGPVVPNLYDRLKMFGSDNVMNVFRPETIPEDSTEYSIVKEVVDHLKNYSAGKLVSITHRNEGAWAKHYIPRCNVTIPTESIKQEYNVLYGCNA